MDHNNIIECGGFYFIHNFDSGNLGHVERVPTELIAPTVNPKTNVSECPDYEFNMWTRPDCAGTEFENGNRTWFYFGIQAREPNVTVRLNLINLNKQGKMYNQGMAPVTRTLPGKPQWERIRDRPVHSMDDNTFTLSFKYRTSDNMKATTFFAFTYPFSFAELQIALNSIDLKMLPAPSPQAPDDIYYWRECVIYSLEGRRVDLLTITSHHGITAEREERLKHLFPENKPRAFKFQNKKVIFISARVHPGETPSSFVFNGFLNLLLTRHDPVAMQLRKLYVFKLVPFLNPDGVARGHYRTDTRGVNLNRVYLNPSLVYHPTVYASRALIRYYHFGCEKEDTFEDSKSFTSRSIQNINESVEILESKKKKNPSYKSKPVSNMSSSTIKTGRSATDAKPAGDLPDQMTDTKKNVPYKAKSASVNKSSSTLKRPSTADGSKVPSVTTKTQSTGEDNLIHQVCDLKLREMTSQTLESRAQESPRSSDSPSLLNDDVLRSCLGSDVHLSTSAELLFQGSNPLLALRDTLKNSISLLMGSPVDSSPRESSQSNVRMGWCHDCRRAVAKLQETLPGLAGTVAGYTATVSQLKIQIPPTSTQPRAGSPCSSIHEYREQQKQQIDEQKTLEKKLQDIEQAEKGENIYFCTNCFKRYIITQNNEEVKLMSGISATSMGVSGGDSGDTAATARADSSDEPTPAVPPPSAEKPPARGRRKAPAPRPKEPESGLYLYIDLHGHASKKGIFMYGNHFEDADSSVECMLLPRIMSLNNMHFHFSSCNFTERNMYLKDRRDGMSREGSGRVAVLKATGLVRSYTLECNYNTGRLVNVLPPAVRDAPAPPSGALAPPKYTPHIFEEVGRSLGASILDLTGQHPNSRVPCSEHRNLAAVRDWLRAHTRNVRPQLTMSRLRPKTSSPTRAPLYARTKSKVVDVERKENTYAGAKSDERAHAPAHSARSVHELALAGRGSERARYLADAEPKPKSLAAKRRGVLALRKPNSSKTQIAAKSKPARRSGDDASSARPALSKSGSKRSFLRVRARAAASSSSDELPAWEEVPGGTLAGAAAGRSRDELAHAHAQGKRRPPAFPPPPHHLKKIRLKTGL